MIYFKMANLQSAQTNWVEVQKTYEACLAIRERLAGQHPENLEWQRELAMTQDKLGDVLLRLGKLEDALKVYYAALAVRKKLAEKEPTKAERQRDLCVSCFRIVAVLEQEPLKQTRKAEVDGFRRRAYDILSGMKHSGMTTPQDEAILEGLRTKLENER